MKAIIQSQILKKTAKILAGKNIDVYTEGFAPRVEYDSVTKEPKAVYIPEIPEGASDKLIAAIQGYIDHECGHILESNGEDICDKTKNKLWHYIHNCIEDPRVNAKMSNKFPGSETNIRNGYNYLFERKGPDGKSPYDEDALDKLDLSNEEMVKDYQVNYSSTWFAKKANCRFTSKKYDEIGLDKLFGPLEAKMNPRYLDAISRAHTAEEVKEATDYFVDFFHKEFDEDGSGGSKEESRDGSAKTGKTEKASTKEHKGRLKDPKKMEDELAKAVMEEIEHLAEKAKENFYFSDKYDRVHKKHDIVSSGAPKVFGFEEETKAVTNYLSKDLRRILESRNRRWYVGGYKAGKLNQKALHSVKTGNDRIFSKKSDIKAVKAAVSLLIDMSGSMISGIDKSKIYVATQSAYAFALVLEQLKVPYEIWGFSTAARIEPGKQKAFEGFSKTADPRIIGKIISPYTSEDFYAFKTFEEKFDIVSKSALVKTANKGVAMQNNEDSIHVKKALERLAARPEDKKSLFVFSDGMPCFSPGNAKASQEMLKHLDKVSKERYGVDIFGIGIKSDSVSHYYKNYRVVQDLNELPSALFDFLKSRI